jgi:hypothetical protein
MEAVVILGAGASAGFGVPTLRYVFQDSEAMAQLGNDSFLARKLENVIWKPRGVDLSSSHLSLTVEEILTMIRDAESDDVPLPRLLNTRDAPKFRRSLYVLIKKAIYDNKSSRRTRVLDPLINYMRGRMFEHVTWASFNWDCMFESAFWYSSGYPRDRHNPSIVVPLKGWLGSTTQKHTFLKLHGAINWWFEGGNINYLSFKPGGTLNAKWKSYEDGTVEGEPVILEPSFYKYSGAMYELLKPQWETFMEALASAGVVIVVGYSLPEADAQARSAVSLGFQWNRKATWIVIDESTDACKRYRHIIGSKRLHMVPEKLEDVNPKLRIRLNSLIDAG